MIVSIISQGFVWAILGLGIFMTFRILNFPDMTTEGSFPLGGAVAVTLITQGFNPFLATLVAVGAGCLAGLATGLLYTKGKIPTLLSGILVMTSCHSIMLMIMGRANLGLLGTKQIQDVLPFSSEVNQLFTGLIFVTLVILLMLFFLDTKLGQAYIATGDNPDMARSFGINTGRMELMGLVLSNGVIALAGALIAQQEGYADVSRGIGVIVVGLASLIIGEVLFKSLTLAERLVTIVVGSISYQFLVWGVIALGFNTSYLRLYSAQILERSQVKQMTAIVELKNATKIVKNGFDEEKIILNDVSLDIYEHDFITILGGNGAGKSTLFNSIAGTLPLTSGSIRIMGENVTHFSPEKRAKYLSRVFQDPKMGTAPRMTVAENLLIAKFRGEKRGLFPRRLSAYKEEFQATIEKVGNGLEKHLDTPIEFLSGGQRQALSLLMATLKRPELLLLDEHTAALDPKTSVALMELTDDFVSKDHLTTLMITHHMEDALKYGNRLIVMKEGRIIQDLNKDEKAKMKISDYYQLFE